MIIGRLKERVELYQKFSVPQENGGIQKKWNHLGEFWAWPDPLSLTYPLSHNGSLYFSGEAYLLVMRMDSRIFMAHRVVWKKKSFSIISTPCAYQKKYYGIKIFSVYKHEHQKTSSISSQESENL